MMIIILFIEYFLNYFTNRLDNAPVFMYIHGGGWVTGHRKYHSLPLLYQVDFISYYYSFKNELILF